MKTADIHSRSLATSTALSVYYVENLITPLEVIKVLNDAGVKFMLVGAHGIGGWLKDPRATQDVDVLVAMRSQKKAINALLAAFPQLQSEDHPGVTRLRDKLTGEVRIDVMKPNQELFREGLKHTQTVESKGQVYNIPSLEMALTMKFAPMIRLNRADKDKYQGAHDFMQMIDSNPNIELEKLAELGNLVYPGGGTEIVEKVRQVRAGEKLIL
jgi:hypothetical protein